MSCLSEQDLEELERICSVIDTDMWKIIRNDDVEAVWIVPECGKNPIALLDYMDGEHNRLVAEFIVGVCNNAQEMLSEIRSLRERVTELLVANNVEVEKRIALENQVIDLVKKDDSVK